MRTRASVLVIAFLIVCATGHAATTGFTSTVTGSASPALTQVNVGIPTNILVEVVGIVPVVSTVSGTPASMAAAVNVPGGTFNQCGGTSTPGCGNDLWVGQWTITSDSGGIRAVNAYQGGTLKLSNNSGVTAVINLRCQTGLMTGSCIFVLRLLPIGDPLF